MGNRSTRNSIYYSGRIPISIRDDLNEIKASLNDSTIAQKRKGMEMIYFALWEMEFCNGRNPDESEEQLLQRFQAELGTLEEFIKYRMKIELGIDYEP